MKISADGHYWGNVLSPAQAVPVAQGGWTCVGLMIKLTSAPDERDDDWFGFKDQKRFAIKHIQFKIYTESETNMNRLKAGDIDIGGLNGTRYREWVKEETDMSSPFKNGDIEVALQKRTGYLYFGWKNTDPRFKDKRVRKALTEPQAHLLVHGPRLLPRLHKRSSGATSS